MKNEDYESFAGYRALLVHRALAEVLEGLLLPSPRKLNRRCADRLRPAPAFEILTAEPNRTFGGAV